MADLLAVAQTYTNAGAAVAASNLGANALKVNNTYGGYGVRKLSAYNIDVANAETNPTFSNSVYSQAVRALQQIAEVYFVGTPTADGFFVLLSEDTTPATGPGYDTDATPTVAERIEDALQAAGLTVTAVAAVTVAGAGTFA